jgi:hypothetical protein
MIDGLSHLLTMRRAGQRPRSLMLSVECPFVNPVYAREFEEMELTVHGSVATDDFRAFKGLVVTLYVGTWNQLAADTLEKLQKYADEIVVLCADFGEDLGYFWTLEHGAIDFDDYKWVKQYHAARCSVCRTKAETDQRLKLEAEALMHVPHMEASYGATAAR